MNNILKIISFKSFNRKATFSKDFSQVQRQKNHLFTMSLKDFSTLSMPLQFSADFDLSGSVTLNATSPLNASFSDL